MLYKGFETGSDQPRKPASEEKAPDVNPNSLDAMKRRFIEQFPALRRNREKHATLADAAGALLSESGDYPTSSEIFSPPVTLLSSSAEEVKEGGGKKKKKYIVAILIAALVVVMLVYMNRRRK